ncbi:MAG TPA: SUMF1/EgtB/PvdO family nonheme iron enzyme [Thermoanaerobaculia bacterium]|nr:SUMF1/EgtB/PvdO family nonheme iron enzyme [Thermoanaerobaculia bacterium]
MSSTDSGIPRPSAPSILDDLPAHRDALDFGPYVETLADIVSSPQTSTPLTVGIFGSWGSGKTTLLGMIRQRLPETSTSLWFDAWKYDKQEALWRALLLRVLAELREVVRKGKSADVRKDLAELEDLESALYRAVDREEVGQVRIDWGKLGTGAGQGAVQIALSLVPGGKIFSDLVQGLQGEQAESAVDALATAVRRERIQVHIDQVQFLEQFQDRFRRLVEMYVIGRGEGKGRLVVFVDDLDRCLPEKAVEVLEAIKLFLDVPGCAFVLGLDHQVIAKGIEAKHKEPGAIDGRAYLEKIIQVPFQIPPIEEQDLEAFVAGLVPSWPDPECARVFAVALGGNPRRVKRTVNVFLLLWRLAEARAERLQGKIRPVRLAKVVALQHVEPNLYEILRETPRLLRDLEDHLTSAQIGEREGKAEPPPVLAPFVDRLAVRRLFALHSGPSEANFTKLTPEDLQLYFTLTRRAEAPTPAVADQPRAVFEPAMVHIPAGSFLMGSTEEQVKRGKAHEDETPQHLVELNEYWIGKYPITNAEYQSFLRESGHPSPQEWSGTDYPEGKGGHPVVGVSWTDCVAYCRWLNKKTGKRYNLPSEAEWEKAARGTDGRAYPWGNRLDPQRRNSTKWRWGGTTPVGQYSPSDDSPYRIADAVGNVWEWTGSLYKPYPYDPADGREEVGSRGRRVVRGGSYIDSSGDVRCASRDRYDPDARGVNIGFRVVVAPFSSDL